ARRGRSIFSHCANYLAAEQNERPDGTQKYERHENGRRTDVLCQPRERVPLQADPVDRGLDRTVDELDDENEQHRSGQQSPFDSVTSEQQAQRYDEHGAGEFLPEGGLVPESPGKPTPAGAQGPDDPGDAPGLVTIYECAVGFHVRSSCLAARTSSRRRTGMVCGALVTRSGSWLASAWICAIASAKASSVSLLSVSVGSISRHSGTRSGK